MDANERSCFGINDQKKELKNIMSESSLYFDQSLLKRENFLRYLVALVLSD